MTALFFGSGSVGVGGSVSHALSALGGEAALLSLVPGRFRGVGMRAGFAGSPGRRDRRLRHANFERGRPDQSRKSHNSERRNVDVLEEDYCYMPDAISFRRRGLRAEGAAAAAGRFHIRIVELESGAFQRLDIIDLHAIQIEQACLVNEKL